MAAWLTVQDIHILNAMIVVGPQLDRDIRKVVRRHSRYLKEKAAKRAKARLLILDTPALPKTWMPQLLTFEPKPFTRSDTWNEKRLPVAPV